MINRDKIYHNLNIPYYFNQILALIITPKGVGGETHSLVIIIGLSSLMSYHYLKIYVIFKNISL